MTLRETERTSSDVSKPTGAPAPPPLDQLFDFLKVTNLTDAKRSIIGLRERVKFTENYESLKFELERLRAAAAPASQSQPANESGNCPHCGAWVNFAQEAEIAGIDLTPPASPPEPEQ